MWRSLKNVLLSFRTYSDLSPDLRLRRRINRSLHPRPLLKSGEWHQTYWQPHDVSRALSDFIYYHLQEAAGIDIGRTQPSDRLTEDLCLPLICWFDWETSFSEAFLTQFGIDLPPDWAIPPQTTLKDWLLYLNQQILSVKHS